MAKEIQILRITEPISVGSFKVAVNNELKTDVVKFDNGEVKVKYTNDGGASYFTPAIPKDCSKLVWQKAQQQQ